jgi:glutamyl-tRNA synthetase
LKASALCCLAASTEAVLRAYAEEAGVKLGAVAQPLRAALTGKTTSPPIFDVLGVLGKEESVARLRDRTPAAVPGQTAGSAPL